MRYTSNNAKVEDFNASYAFSRSLLTCLLFGSPFLLFSNYNDWKYYAVLIPIVIVVWIRCKQRGYYYAREVLSQFLKYKQQ